MLALAGALAIGPGAPTRGGVATARVILDTPHSQLVYAAPANTESLQARTVVLSHVIASDDVAAQLARAISVPASDFAVDDALFDAPANPTTLPKIADDAALTRPERFSLVVRNDDVLPIISFEAHAPDRQAAIRIIDATERLIPSLIAPPGDGALNRVVVERFLPTKAREVVGSPSYVKAVGASVVMFGLWCACWALVRGRRSRTRTGVAAACV